MCPRGHLACFWRVLSSLSFTVLCEKNLSTNQFYHWIFHHSIGSVDLLMMGDHPEPGRPFRLSSMLRDRYISLQMLAGIRRSATATFIEQRLLQDAWISTTAQQQFPISYSGFPSFFFLPRQPVRSNEHGTLWCSELMMETHNLWMLREMSPYANQKKPPRMNLKERDLGDRPWELLNC